MRDLVVNRLGRLRMHLLLLDCLLVKTRVHVAFGDTFVLHYLFAGLAYCGFRTHGTCRLHRFTFGSLR